MRQLDWQDPRDNIMSYKKVRQIFYLREGISIQKHMKEMESSGIKPIRYLSHFGMIVGEINQYYSAYSFRHPDIEHWEPDIRITINEPYVGSLSGLENKVLPWGVESIEAEKTWSITKGDGVRVAIIDTGIDREHPSISTNYRGGINVLSPFSEPQDYNGHGTHVAGIICGGSTELDILGVAPKAHVYAVKAFNRRGSANLSDLLSALNWCIENKMQVINMSFGMEKMSESLRLAIQVAHGKGIIMVAATGNQGLSSRIDYPARYPETIGVTSISKNNKISLFSNLGKGMDIAAPGDKIISAWLNRSKREMSGTSMAVPHVSGVVSLILSLNPDLNTENLRYILTKSAKQLNNDELGVVNANSAIQMYVSTNQMRPSINIG